MRAESTSNKREHWGTRADRSKRERNAVALMLKPKINNGGLGKTRLVVLLTRVAPHELDDDNLRGALKAFRDGVATALRVDDRSPLVRWDYAQRKGDQPNLYEVEILISWESPSDELWDRLPTPQGRVEQRRAARFVEESLAGGFIGPGDLE